MNIGNIDALKDKNLIDQENLQIRKMYIYEITNHKDKGFVKEQTLSIMHVKHFDPGVINVVRDEEQQTITQENRANNSKGNTAVFVPRVSGMQYSTEEHITKSNNVLIATLDEPLNIANGKTNREIYFIDGIDRQLIVPRTIHGKTNKTNPTSFTLTNTNDIMANYNALKFLFTWEDEIENPSEVDLQLDNYALLSKVMAKGEVDGKKHQDIDLKMNADSSKFSLLTMTPTSTNYKLSLFSHWLDSNKTLAFAKAKTFLTKASLKTLFNVSNADFAGWSTTEITDAYKVVISMMKLTQAYATNFHEYRDANNNITGAINGIALADFADKNPINAIDGFVESWKAKYPGQVESPGFKVMTEVIAMLSNHINSTYSVARGNNDFMKVYLPWYFVPQTAITNALADDADFEVILKSEYFQLVNQDPIVKRTHSYTLARGEDKNPETISFPFKYVKDNELDFNSGIEVDIFLKYYISSQWVGSYHATYSQSGLTGINENGAFSNEVKMPVASNDGITIEAIRDNLDDAYFTIEYTYKNIPSIFPLDIKEKYRNISEYQAHDLNGWISQPELPNKIMPINKFARPGDIDIKSDNDLKYLLYIPFNNNQVLEDLYGELHTTKQSGWHDEGITRRYDQTFTINQDYNMGELKLPDINEKDAEKLVQLPLNARIKTNSITNLKVSIIRQWNTLVGVPFVGTVGEWYMTYQVEFDYELEVNGSATISTITHAGTIYDKLNWRSVANNLTNGSNKYQLNLITDNTFHLNVDKINELNIQSVWLDTLSLSITNGSKTISFSDIELPSVDDETLTNMTILL